MNEGNAMNEEKCITFGIQCVYRMGGDLVYLASWLQLKNSVGTRLLYLDYWLLLKPVDKRQKDY